MSRTRSRSPVTVEEWVAALPEEGAGGEEDEKQERQEKGEEDEEDTLSLGAEAVLQGLVENSRGEQEEQLRPSRTSATSLISSCCSRESLLQSREPDPEQVNSSLNPPLPFLQVLLGLGFGGTDSVTSIPKRFLIAPSKARGVCIETFKKQERVEHSRYHQMSQNTCPLYMAKGVISETGTSYILELPKLGGPPHHPGVQEDHFDFDHFLHLYQYTRPCKGSVRLN